MKKFLTAVLSAFMILSLAGCGLSTNKDPSKEASGKDYESKVFTAFWEDACSAFGVNYSDYKWTHTATSYISDSTTSDGYIAHYYLIKTAFNTKNIFGQTINHEVTARCYYVPDYSNVVYTTYLTLDGEKILFDEETEDWLLGIGGSSVSPNKSETTLHSHSYGNWVNSNTGQHKRICLSCNNVEYANHAWNNGQVTQTPSCAANGITTFNCDVCGGIKTKAIPKTDNHSWDSGKVTQTATCSAEGVITYTCDVCKQQKTKPIGKAAHVFSQKVESSEYLKSNASFYSGTTYYFSCACGEKGTETFSLNDRKEWINAEQLKQSYGYGYAWMGEFIWLGRTDWDTNTSINYNIYGSPTSKLSHGVIYSGNCNGNTVRFKYESSNYFGTGLFFNFNDLVAAGII